MNKIVIQKDQARLYGQPHPIPQGQSQFSEIEFSFSEEWANLRKIAQFEQKSGPYNVDISDNKCFCPSELVKGWVKIRVKGYPEDTTSAVIATANEITLPVSMGFKSGGTPSVPPTPDLYQRLLNKIQTQIGDLRNLTTNDKDNLVAAINEAATSGGAGWNQFEINAESGTQNNDYEYQVTLDKTYDEIDAAFTSGSTPIVILDNRWRLQVISATTGYHFGVFAQMGPGMYGIFDVYVSNREEWLLELPMVDYANFVPFAESVEAEIGNLADLTTEAKENLVAAINEVARTGGGAGSMDLRVADGYIQYSTDSGSTWTNLISVADLKGPKGDPGKTPVKGTDYWTASDKAEIAHDIHPAFYIDLAGDYPNYTCQVAMDDIKAAYNSGYNLVCRCTLAAYTATLPLFVPMPAANTWIFSGSGALQSMGFPAQSFTVAITADGVVAQQTRLARADGTLPNPSPIRIKVGDTTYIYNGSEPVDVTIDDGTEVSY